MENQEFNQEEQGQETPSFEFVSDAEVDQINVQEEQPEILDLSGENPVEEVSETLEQETPVMEESQEETYDEQQIEEAVFSYLSERLGRDVGSIDDLTIQQQEEQRIIEMEAFYKAQFGDDYF